MTPRWDAELTSFIESRRRILARRRRFVKSTIVVLAVVLLACGGVFAWFKSTGSATASGSVGIFNAPGKPSTSVVGTSVHLSWSAAALPDGSSSGVEYHVERRPDPGGTWTDACNSSTSAPIAPTSCDDSPGTGTFAYRVTAQFNSWTATGPESDPIVAAIVATKLVFLTSPLTTTAGVASGTITIQRQDNAGTPGTAGSATVTLASSAGSGTFRDIADTTTITTVTIPDGASDASFKYKDIAAGTPTITVTDTPDGLTQATQTETVTPAGASHIVLSGAATNLASGSTRLLTATVEDAFGNTVTSGVDSSVSINFAPASGSGTVSGTGNAVASSGVATKTVTGVLAGGVDMTATAILSGPGGTTSNTLSFTVVHGTASQIALSGAITSLASGSTRQLTATIEDAAGNTVNDGPDATDSITFAKTGGGGGTVSGLTTVAASGGVATDTVTGVLAGSVTLRANGTVNGGATNSNNLTFTVTFGTASKIVMSGSTSNLASGSTRAVTATIQDAAGNTVAGGADSTATLTFTKATGSGTVSGLTSIAASGGVATDTVTGVLAGSVSVQAAGTLNGNAVTSGNTLTFTVTFGTASQIVLSGSIADLASATGRQFTATIEDAAGNTITSGPDSNNTITFSQAAGTGSVTGTGTSGASNGVATKTITGNLVGTVTLRASGTVNGSAMNSNALNFNVIHGTATQIVLSGAVTNLSSGSTRQFTATIEDANGNIVIDGADATDSITFSKTAGTGSVTGLTTVAAAAGVATDTVTGNLAGSATLRANGTVNGSATNSNTLTFTVVAGAVSQLAFTAQPGGGATGGVAFPTQPAVTAQDAAGNTASTYAGTVTLSIKSGTGTGGATLSGCSGTLTSGVTSFSGCKIDKSGTNYVLTASDATRSVDSTAFNVSAGPAAKFNITGSAGSITAGGTVNLTVTAVDAGGNTATSYTGDQSLTFSGANSVGPNAPTVSSKTGTPTAFGTATTITFASGVATVSGANNGVATLYKAETASISATAGAVTTQTPASVTVNVGAAAKLAWTNITAPASGVPASCYFTCPYPSFGNNGTFTARVSITDSAGNVVSSIGTTTTISVSAVIQSSGGAFTAPTPGTGAQTLTVPAAGLASSSVAFSYKTGTGSWTSDSLTAHVTAGTARTDATATLSK